MIKFEKLGIQVKFLIPISIIILLLISVLTVIIARNQVNQLQSEYHDQLSTLAISSTMMVHSFAEEFATERDLRFHRVYEGSHSYDNEVKKLEEEAYVAFQRNPDRKTYEGVISHEGTPYLYVYAPARIQRNCLWCHHEDGLDIFGNQKEGDLTGLFGVSGSTRHLITQKSNIYMMAFLACLSVLLFIGLAMRYFSSVVITKPINKMIEFAETVAQGDLRNEIPVENQDELGKLGSALNKMIRNLRQTIFQVEEASVAVASSTAEISSSMEQMAAGAQEQTSQADEVASAVEEMSRTIIDNSKNASDTSEMAHHARKTAEAGRKIVGDTIAGMKRMAEAVRKSAVTIETLGHSSDQIGEIVSVIDDIADQTNLLALNAAIEAARAGEQGRGFAVVADEVRKLAERTTKATKEIAEMIKKIQHDTTDAVQSMEEGTREVDAGIELADKASVSLEEIVTLVQKVNNMIEQIAAASDQQSGTSEQISRNVETISSVTQETASGIEQVARAAEDLNRLTENLQTLVGSFKLDYSAEMHHSMPDTKTMRRLHDLQQRSRTLVRENGYVINAE
jgi:methyl-accepting chemotaxis protein